MARQSPLRSAQPDSLSVCGKILKKGQSITVPESAIGPRERKLASKKRISIRKSTKPGRLQVVCLKPGK